MMPLEIAVPAVCAAGVPLLPVGEPGAAISPGNKSCSFVAAAALMMMRSAFQVAPPVTGASCVQLGKGIGFSGWLPSMAASGA